MPPRRSTKLRFPDATPILHEVLSGAIDEIQGPGLSLQPPTTDEGPAGEAHVELLRGVHTPAADRTDSVAEAAAQDQTPGPDPADAKAVLRLPSLSASSESPGHDDVVPWELARHQRYRVVRLIGEGGMGSVYEAEHRVMQRAVALKVIKRAFTDNPARVERFRREVRTAARLSHPNIVTTYDAEDTGTTLFLVMEYVEGVSLGRLVKERGPLPVPEACDHVRQAALGLQHAHERGMVHRDVKPDNLMLVASPDASAPGVVKVLDFGLAALTAERSDGVTNTNVIMGTPDYMAPEQAEDARRADIRADVYSLGCTLYYLLTGNVPYPAATSLLKILAHREKSLPSLGQARPEVPPGLARVVARMLAKKPEDRYQTPREVAAALAPFTTKALPTPPKRRRRVLVAALAALLLTAIGLAGAMVYRIQTDTGELIINTESDDVVVEIRQGGKLVHISDAKTDQQITLALRAGVYELVLKGVPEGLKLNIDKATLARGETVLAKIERVPRQPPEKRIDEIKVMQRIAYPGNPAIYAMAVSPDGKLFAADLDYGGGTDVVVWDGQSAKELQRFKGWVSQFSPDGKRFLFNVGEFLLVYDSETWKKLLTISGPKGIPCWGFYTLPGNRHVIYWTAQHTFHLIDMEADRILHSWTYQEGKPPVQAGTPDGRVVFVKPVGEKNPLAWDVQNNKPSVEFAQLAKYEVVRAFLPGNKQAVVHNLVTNKGKFVVSLADGKCLPIPEGDWGPNVVVIETMAFDYPQLIGYADGKVRLFDELTGKEYASFQIPNGEKLFGNRKLALSMDGRHACMSTDRAIYLLRLPDPPAGKGNSLRVCSDSPFTP